MEHFFDRPYCGERISMMLDVSVRRQMYVEDCEVCCNPIEVSYEIDRETLVRFQAAKL